MRSVSTLIRMSATAAPSTRRALTLALALYLLWVLVTYLLEGRILTLQRPEATGARLAYELVANILIGIGGSYSHLTTTGSHWCAASLRPHCQHLRRDRRIGSSDPLPVEFE